MDLSKLCAPAYLYLVICTIYLLINSFIKFDFMTIITTTVMYVLWALFLNFLCSKGLGNVAWLLVLLPLLISIIYYFTLYI